MARMIGRIDDWDTTLFVESGWTLTHLRLDYRGRELEIELDKEKVKKLIELLEKSIR